MLSNLFFTIAVFVFSADVVNSVSDESNAVSIFDSSGHTQRDLQTLGSGQYAFEFTNVYASGTGFQHLFRLASFPTSGASPARFEIYTAPDGANATGDPTLSCYSKGGENFGYTSTNKEIKYIYCAKFTLTQDISSTPVDMNFIEVAVQITVALNGTLGGSSVDAFEVDTGAAGTDTDNDLEYTASAGLCSTFSGNPTQGENIPICIVSDDHPLASIVSVQDLSFTSGDSLTQSIIASGSAAPGAADLYGVPEPLNAAHCLANKCIQYNVMLYAIIATVGDNLDITIRGNIVLAIGDGTRTLRAQFKPTRALQDALREQAFSSTIVLPALPTTESGAVSTVGTKITAAMVSLGAALVSGWMFAV
jgi:hypothetical protein